MKTFTCQCGNTLHFENTQCLVCGRAVGFLPDQLHLSALDPVGDGQLRALSNGNLYRKCDNFERYDICNWLVPEGDNNIYCASCRLNHIIPNLSEPENLVLWYRIETAKHRA
jgi:hypothetical protein